MGLFSALGELASGVGRAAIDSISKESANMRQTMNRSYGMSDMDLINGFQNKNNSIGERMGYLQTLKNRHKR